MTPPSDRLNKLNDARTPERKLNETRTDTKRSDSARARGPPNEREVTHRRNVPQKVKNEYPSPSPA